MQPKTRYATSGDASIAFQLVGDDGPFLVFVPPWNSNVEQYWEDPASLRFFRGLASFSRTIIYDKRGAGLSDPLKESVTLEQLAGDLNAVLDAAGAEEATLFGSLWGGPTSILFAASHPERTSRLVLYGAFATRVRDDDYPWAPTQEERDERLRKFVEGWTEGEDIHELAPSAADDPRFRAWWARMHRLAASPGTLQAEVEMLRSVDVRSVLPTISVPTLVLHRRGDRLIPPGNGRYLANHIPNARYVELEGEDHMPFVGDVDALLGEVEEWVTGERRGRALDRALLTVVFTDIVGSTDRASEVGDERWRQILHDHDLAVRKELERFEGREIKTMGDGFLATFDGPVRALRCSLAIRDAVRPLGLEIRAGLHTGQCELIGQDVGGMSVNIAARIAGLAGPGDVVVSGAVRDLAAGAGVRFSDHGHHTLRGVPGDWRLWKVES